MATTVTNEISIAGPLTNIPQPLQDEGENRSALQIGTTQVVVTAPQLAPGQQPFALAEDKVFFIDATVSSKAVVTVAVKDATVRIAIPQGVPVPQEPSPPGDATP